MPRGFAVVCALMALSPTLAPAGSAGAETGEALPEPEVELVEAGAEPRTALRYRLTPGQDATARLELRMAVAASLPSVAIPAVAVPPLDAGLTLRVEAVDPDGAAVLALSIDEVAVERVEGIVGQLLMTPFARLESLRGATCRYRLSSRGVAHDLACRDRKGAAIRVGESARETLRNAYVVFPEDPVGAGARWRATTTPADAGASWVGEWEYALLGVEDGHLEIEVNSRRNLRRRVRRDSATGQRVELALRAWARGTAEPDPSAPAWPIDLSGGASYETLLRAGSGVGAAAQKVRMELDVRARLRPDS